jgi:NSS family neurotransmitter:Na+ symporter
VGLGNLWKFPYIAYDNDGGTFVLVYLFCIALVGMPIMLAEILLGRRAQASSVPAIEKLSADVPGGKNWGVVGWVGVIAGMVILSFYAVIAGWSLSSFANCIKWTFTGYDGYDGDAFTAFLANGPTQILLTFLFSAATAVIVVRGISGGIEKATRILMPVLMVILVLLVINSFRLEGFGEALGFLFTPTSMKPEGILEALGHAFFTLSLGMGAMITYGSYMGKKESINKSAIAIVLLDTIIAIMACIIMYTIIFTYPEIKDTIGRSAVGMLFVTLPEMFYTKMPGGQVIGPVFYILVSFAALSSTISLLEVVVALFVDKLKFSRKKATITASASIFALSTLCALSLGAVSWISNFKFFGQSETGIGNYLNQVFFTNKSGFLDLFDHFASNWFLPVGGLLITIFVGWFLKPEVIKEELGYVDDEGKPTLPYYVYLMLIRFIAPAAIIYIIYEVFMGTDFS